MVTGAKSQNRLFIIGNGFDLAHGLSTRFDPDFRKIAIGKEADSQFWDLYQSEAPDIWSDFENVLARPNFDELIQIFDAYPPDYSSDRESDRDSSILQAEISGKLNESLRDFATQAEDELQSTKTRFLYRNLLTSESLYVSFNYTHTLETLYGIPSGNVLHIHGEAGVSKLLLGYDANDFDEGKISEDVTGHGQYRGVPAAKYIDGVEDYYVRTAYENLLSTVRLWGKPYQTDKLMSFVKGATIDEIVVVGFSFGKVDAIYFKLLQKLYPGCRFIATAIDEQRAIEYKGRILEYYDLKNYVTKLL